MLDRRRGMADTPRCPRPRLRRLSRHRSARSLVCGSAISTLAEPGVPAARTADATPSSPAWRRVAAKCRGPRVGDARPRREPQAPARTCRARSFAPRGRWLQPRPADPQRVAPRLLPRSTDIFRPSSLSADACDALPAGCHGYAVEPPGAPARHHAPCRKREGDFCAEPAPRPSVKVARIVQLRAGS